MGILTAEKEISNPRQRVIFANKSIVTKTVKECSRLLYEEGAMSFLSYEVPLQAK